MLPEELFNKHFIGGLFSSARKILPRTVHPKSNLTSPKTSIPSNLYATFIVTFMGKSHSTNTDVSRMSTSVRVARKGLVSAHTGFNVRAITSALCIYTFKQPAKKLKWNSSIHGCRAACNQFNIIATVSYFYYQFFAKAMHQKKRKCDSVCSGTSKVLDECFIHASSLIYNESFQDPGSVCI